VRAVNLIPAEQRGGLARGAGRSGGGAYAVLALLCGLAVLVFIYGIARHQVSSRRAQVATLAAQAARSQAVEAQLAPYTSFIAMREQRQQAVLQLVDSRFDWAHALHELGRVLPLGTTVTSLSGAVGSGSSAAGGSGSGSGSGAKASATVASATPPGSLPSFIIGGCATSQSEVALTLDRLRLMDGAKEVTLKSSTKTANAAGGIGSGGCRGSDPAFTVQVSFTALPASSAASPSATGSATAPAANTSSSPASTTTTGGAG